MIKSLFQRKLSAKEQEGLDLLNQVDLFAGLKRDAMLEIGSHMYERNYNKGEVIFFRSDASQALYIVKNGSVELSLDIGTDNDELLYVCHENYSLGINSILMDQNRDFNAIVCSEHADLIVIAQSDLINMFKRNKTMKIQVLENFAHIYEGMFSKMFKIYKNNVGFFELSKIFEN